MDEKYCSVSKLMAIEPFMAMKRELSAFERSDDDQRHINEDFERVSVIGRTIDLERWEKLIMRLASLFIPKDPEVLIYDDHYSTVADPGAMATEKNPRKG